MAEPQKLYSHIYGEILVEMMWWNNGVKMVKVCGGKLLDDARAVGRKIDFLYWRLSSPEREATNEDLKKALPPGDPLIEAILARENQDIPEMTKVLAIRRKIMKSAGVSL